MNKVFDPDYQDKTMRFHDIEDPADPSGRAIKIEHLPTGDVVIGTGEGNRYRNRTKALLLLADILGE
jgi:hypothetical protein